MNNEYLQQQFISITYNDDTDVVALRYLLLHALALYAAEYNSRRGTREALQLLQHYQVLENTHTDIKEKCRNNTACEKDFKFAKAIGIEYITKLDGIRTFVSAA